MNPRRPARASAALRWRQPKQLPRACPEPAPRDWLLDTGSLTRRLQARCTGRFQVRVVAQGWGRPRLDECRALGLRRPLYALIREVQLLCAGRPWVFARTIIPIGTLRGRERRLAQLGARPLGALLFADPHMRRGPLEVACVCAGQPLYHTAVQGLAAPPARIWGRRSVFRLGGKPLLVSEFFLRTPPP
ncbi:MAG: chorismate lyase [Gammaproteobacteria bacterium]